MRLYSGVWQNFIATGARLHFETWNAPLVPTRRTPRRSPACCRGLLALVAIGTGLAWRDARARMWLAIGIVGAALSFGPALPGYSLLYDLVPDTAGHPCSGEVRAPAAARGGRAGGIRSGRDPCPSCRRRSRAPRPGDRPGGGCRRQCGERAGPDGVRALRRHSRRVCRTRPRTTMPSSPSCRSPNPSASRSTPRRCMPRRVIGDGSSMGTRATRRRATSITTWRSGPSPIRRPLDALRQRWCHPHRRRRRESARCRRGVAEDARRPPPRVGHTTQNLSHQVAPLRGVQSMRLTSPPFAFTTRGDAARRAVPTRTC